MISQREVGDTLQDFEKRRYLILSDLRAQKNLSTAAFFNMNSRNSIARSALVGSCMKRERFGKVPPTFFWRSVHKLFIHAFVVKENKNAWWFFMNCGMIKGTFVCEIMRCSFSLQTFWIELIDIEMHTCENLQ